ncbi:MAG: hypothetical protein ACTTHG_06215 [Treponemataceae bacterium]
MMKFLKTNKIIIIFLFSAFFITSAFASPLGKKLTPNEDEKTKFHFFGLKMGMGTSIVFYEDTAILNLTGTDFLRESSTRFILNSELEGVFFLNDYLSIDSGAMLWFDYFKNRGNSMFLLNYDFFIGFRIYPMLKGFCFGIDYITGSYNNFLQYSTAKTNSQGNWSNGFRIIAEYNFMENRIGWTPAVGAYWQNMRCIGGYNNILALYFKACLR